MPSVLSTLTAGAGLASIALAAPPTYGGNALPVSSQSTCDGITYINRGLVAYGTVASDARDKLGDTLGGFGSGAAPDVSSFKLGRNGTISGTLYAVPDRGWNTEGSINYQARVQIFDLTFQPTFGSIENGTENLDLAYEDTTLFSKGSDPTTGLDADTSIPAGNGFPILPAAVMPNGETSPALDQEGLVRLRDGSYWVSDEYGPYIYHFSKQGQMLEAIQPPVSFLPFTNGMLNFTSGNPPVGSNAVAADDPDSGRVNNHGLEGLAISPDQRLLTAQLQEALVEDGGTHSTRENNTRQLQYDITANPPRLLHEWVVQQPAVFDPTENKNPRSTSASELHYLSANQYFILARDSGHGRGSGSNTPSTYRHIDIVSTPGATDIAPSDQGPGALAVAPNGYLLPNIKTENYCSFINFNNNTDLARFGLHNGGPYAGELNEKWESIAIVPVPVGAPGYGSQEFYIISVSDNDFITQNGYYNFGKTHYSDASGLDVSTQVLVWQAHLPNYVSA